MRNFLFTLLLVSVAVLSHAQDRRCGTVQYLKMQFSQDPSLELRMKNADILREQRIAESLNKVQAVITIPVVFHVVYNTSNQNVTDERILEQLDVLNNDYARINQDAQSTPIGFLSVASGTQIQFCLAKRDPSGKPTTGIERKQSTVETFAFDDVTSTTTGGLNAWNSANYLNIWVCPLSNNLLGFGTLPGTTTAAMDGVVVSYTTVGGPDAVGINPTYNLGRTLSHEVGHYFNLSHIWGDDGSACTGTDNVADTPNQAGENFGFPIYPSITCSNGPNGDMFINYLDYSDDLAMNSFSAGQATRMYDALTNDRSALISSNGCSSPAPLAVDAGIVKTIAANGVYCSNSITPSVVIKNHGTSALTSAIIKFSVDDSAFQQINWTGNLTTGNSDTLALDTIITSSGVHTFTVKFSVNDLNQSNDMYVSTFTTMPSGLILPYKEDFESKRFPADSGRITNELNDASTWMRTRMASTSSNSSMWIYAPTTITPGTSDDYQLPPLDMTSLSQPLMSFDVAYSHNPSLGGTHSLIILASADCGETFTEVYSKSGNALATTTNASLPFIPTNNDWRKDTLSLAGYNSTSHLLLKFRSVAGNENAVYVDNINIARFGDIFPDASAINLSQLQSGTNGVLRFKVKLLKDNSCNISIYNILGQKLMSGDYTGTDIEFPSKNEGKFIPYLSTGVYVVRVITPGEKKSFKLFFKSGK